EGRLQLPAAGFCRRVRGRRGACPRRLGRKSQRVALGGDWLHLAGRGAGGADNAPHNGVNRADSVLPLDCDSRRYGRRNARGARGEGDRAKPRRHAVGDRPSAGRGGPAGRDMDRARAAGPGVLRPAGAAVVGGRQLRRSRDGIELRRRRRGFGALSPRARERDAMGRRAPGMPRRGRHVCGRALIMPVILLRAIVLFVAALPFVYDLFVVYSAVSARRSFRMRRRLTSDFTPPVSVLKPVRGLDRASYENFATFCRQDYPDYEVLFAVADESDPAIEVIRRLIESHPERSIRLLIGAPELGSGSKVNKLCPLIREARHDLVVIS